MTEKHEEQKIQENKQETDRREALTLLDTAFEEAGKARSLASDRQWLEALEASDFSRRALLDAGHYLRELRQNQREKGTRQ